MPSIYGPAGYSSAELPDETPESEYDTRAQHPYHAVRGSGRIVNGLEVIYNFMRDSAHLKEIGAAGWFIRRYMFITQVRCDDCRDKLQQRRIDNEVR